jgi:hypothetical protein
MIRIMALALLLGSISAQSLAASPTVETADGNWGQLPKLKQRSSDHMSNVAINRIHEIAEERKCQIPGASTRGLTQFEMSFAAQFQPDGTLTRVLLPRLACPEAEGILGGILLKMIEGGDYRPSGKTEDGWYRGELSFTIGG